MWMVNRLGVCSWSLRTHDADELVDRVRLCGLSSVQLALCPLLDDKEQIEKIRLHVDAERISLISGMFETVGEDYSSLETIKITGGVRPDEHWEANLEMAEQCAVLAQDFGLALVTLHAGFIPEDQPELHERMVGRICRIADTFNARGITLGLETGQERAETLLELLSTIASRVRVGVNFDPANMILYGMGDPVESLRQLRDHIVQVHMKDARATDAPGTWGAEVPAGDGEVDWDSFFESVHALPDGVDVIVEREAGEQRVDDIRKAYALAMTQMKRVQS
jgi:L-ribulose-5-phosphate 3-epimerase